MSPAPVPGQLVLLVGLASTRKLVEPQKLTFGDSLLCPEGEPDTVIPDGGHLINLTHAETVNRYPLERMRWHAG